MTDDRWFPIDIPPVPPGVKPIFEADFQAREASERKEMNPCPVCEVNRNLASSATALAYGVALGAGMGSEASRDLVCEAHRSLYNLASLRAYSFAEISAPPTSEPDEWRCAECGSMGDGVTCYVCQRREDAKDRLYEASKERRYGG